MLISDLDFFKSIEVAEDVVGGDTVSLSIIDGVVSLKLGDSVLYEGKAALPQASSLSSEASFISSSCTTQTVDGVTSSVCSFSTQPTSSSSITRSLRKSTRIRKRRA